MKRCTKTHDAKGFGTIPAGSLWDDDSPYLSDDTAENFADVDDAPEPEPVEPKPVRKSNLRKKAAT
jgi:hypothetical protein